jgi:predicted dinucleotide-binding enzyme
MLFKRRSILLNLTALASLGRQAQASTAASNRLRIAVIGSGRMGGTVGRIWLAAGHEVMFSSRNPQQLGHLLQGFEGRAYAALPQDAVRFGAVVFIATPYQALAALGQALAPDLDGKPVLDATNPRRGATDFWSRQAQHQGYGRISAQLLPGARLVRAFSAVDSWAIQASFSRQRAQLGVPIAGDDDRALELAQRLVRDAGCEPVVVGDLLASRQFDRDGPAWLKNTSASQLKALLKLNP